MLRVLIADDESKVCQLIEKLVDWDALGMEVVAVAENGIEALEKIKEFLHQDWTMTEKTLLIADLLLAGVLIGWLTAPFKGGLFSNNVLGSNNENYYDEDEFEDEED